MSDEKDLTFDQTFDLAIQNHQNNNLQDAKNYYQKVLKIDPNHLGALNNLGVIYKNLQDYQKAKDCYEKIIEIDPNHATALNNLGGVFKKLGENQKAKDCYEKIIEIDPNHADALNGLGAIYKILKENGKAKKSFEKVIELKPDHIDAHNNLGNVFKELGENQKAKDCFEKAIEIDPNHVEAYNNLGVLLLTAGKIKEAKSCYEKVIEINSNYVDAHNNLGNVFTELGQRQKAKDCYEKAIEIDPNHVSALCNLGVVFLELRENQKAKNCYEKALEIDPDNVVISNGLLKTLYKMNNQSILFKELDSMIIEGKMNAVIGSICSRAEAKYGVKKENPFCNDPLNYFLKTNLTEKYDFKNVIIKCVNNILDNNFISNRTQKLITNGYQTAGNLFTNLDFNTSEIQNIIHAEIEKYRFHFKDSKECFIKNWPTNYNLNGWLINMKKGGKLSPHMHDLGWLSGSVYVNVPQKLKTDSGNLVVCIDDEVSKLDKNKNEKSIDVVTGNLCLFPSSLLHYTIPFESDEERIVLAFDVTPT